MSLHQIDEISCVLSQNIPSFNIFYRLTDIGIRKANASGTVHPFIMSSCGGLKWPQLTKRIKRHQFSQHPSHLQTTNAAKNTSLRICLTFVMHFPQQKIDFSGNCRHSFVGHWHSISNPSTVTDAALKNGLHRNRYEYGTRINAR